METKTQLRRALIALLDDPNGVNESGYTELQSLVADLAPGSCGDIFLQVDATDGRFYLPEDHGIVA